MIMVPDDPTIIELDDDALLFEDYDYEDDFGDEDYEEIIYEYEYEDAESPEIIVEYEYVDEEEPPPPPPPKPKYKPSYHHRPKQPYHGNLHGHRLPYHKQHQQPPHHHQYRPRPYHQPQYGHPRPRPRPQQVSGPRFLEEVSGLLARAETAPPHITLSGSLRSALLGGGGGGGVADLADRELRTGPGGRVMAKVDIKLILGSRV